MSRLLRNVEERLRRLDERLGIDHRGRSEWVWLAPLGTLVGTIALVCVAGATSGVGAAVYAPIGALVGAMMGGMSVAYMTPRSDVEPGDGDGGSQAPHGQGPEAPPWYRRLSGALREEPAPRRRGSPAHSRRPRERSGVG